MSAVSERAGCAQVPKTATSNQQPGSSSIFFHAVVPELEQLLWRGHLEGTDDAEAEPLGIGVVPDALGELRILLLPLPTGAAAGGAAQHGKINIIPMAAARHVRIRFRGFEPRVFCARAGELLVSGRVILVETPFHDVSVHIMESPGVG